MVKLYWKLRYKIKFRNLYWPCGCKGYVDSKSTKALDMDLVQCRNCYGFMDREKFFWNK